MNYESFYAQLQTHENGIKTILINQQKIFKRLSKNLENGDVKNAAKDMALLENIQADCQSAVVELRETFENFDPKAYMENGDYSVQLMEYLEKAGVDAKSENNIYEVFPYKIKTYILTANASSVCDRKN